MYPMGGELTTESIVPNHWTTGTWLKQYLLVPVVKKIFSLLKKIYIYLVNKFTKYITW